MTTLSPIATASQSSLPASGPVKGGTRDTSFQAAFSSAAASLQPISSPEPPGKSRKSVDKDEDPKATKQDGPVQKQDVLLSLVVEQPPPVPAEILSTSMPVQGAEQVPEYKSKTANVNGSTSKFTAGLLEAATAKVTSGFPAAPIVDAPTKTVDSKKAATEPQFLPLELAANSTQHKSPIVPQPPQSEALVQGPAEQPSKFPAADKAPVSVDARAIAQAVEPDAKQFVSAPTFSPPASPASTQPTAAADSSSLSAAAQPLPRAASLLTNVGAAKTAQSSGGNPLLRAAPNLGKAEPATKASQTFTQALNQDHGGKGDTKSDNSPMKGNSAGPSAPAAPTTVQAFAGMQNAAAPSASAQSSTSGTSAVLEVPNGSVPSGAVTVSQTAATHASEPSPAAAALPQINTARVLDSMQGTELRVGMHSQEFGSVSIATSISPGGVAAQIAIDHGGLSRALAVHLPGIEEKLGHTLGVQARVEVLSVGAGPTGQGGSAPRDGARQDRGFSSVPTAISTREPFFAQTPPEALEQAGGGLRLSVRA